MSKLSKQVIKDGDKLFAVEGNYHPYNNDLVEGKAFNRAEILQISCSFWILFLLNRSDN